MSVKYELLKQQSRGSLREVKTRLMLNRDYPISEANLCSRDRISIGISRTNDEEQKKEHDSSSITIPSSRPSKCRNQSKQIPTLKLPETVQAVLVGLSSPLQRLTAVWLLPPWPGLGYSVTPPAHRVLNGCTLEIDNDAPCNVLLGCKLSPFQLQSYAR